MAVAFVQSKLAAGFSGTTQAITYDSALTAGNALVGGVIWRTQLITISSVADDQGNTYTLFDNPTDGGADTRGATFIAENVAGATTTTTVTFSGTADLRMLAAHEVSGVPTTGVSDVTAAQEQTDPGMGTDAVTSGTNTTTANGDYIFGCTHTYSGSTTPTVGTGFTVREQSTFRLTTEDLIQVSAGLIAATFTTAAGTDDYINMMVTLKAAGVATGFPIHLSLLGVGA